MHGTRRHVGKRGVPQCRHFKPIQQLPLRFFQLRVDFHEMQDGGRLKSFDDFGRTQGVA